jgi:hypothetical protein
MPRYVIERELPGAGRLSDAEIRAVAKKSCDVLLGMKGTVQWEHSYVTADKIFCVYIAPDEAAVRRHAQEGGFPANKILKVGRIIDPTTSE